MRSVVWVMHCSKSVSIWSPSKHSSWWRRLKDVFMTSWARPIYSSWPYVFKTSSKRFQDALQKRLQDIFKTSWRRFQDIFKTSSRRLPKTSSRRLEEVWPRWIYVLQRCLQEVFKTYHQVKLFLLTSLRDVFNTLETYWKSSRRTAKKDLPRSHFWETKVSVQNLQEW